MDKDVLDRPHRNRACCPGPMLVERHSVVGSPQRNWLTHVVPKCATLLPCKYQFEYIIFRKSVVLEGVRFSARARVNGTVKARTTRYCSMASLMLCSSVVENGPFL